MSNQLSSVWIELVTKSRKVLVCAIYREFSDLASKGQMTINQQLERFKIFHSQVEELENTSPFWGMGSNWFRLSNVRFQSVSDVTCSSYIRRSFSKYYICLYIVCACIVLLGQIDIKANFRFWSVWDVTFRNTMKIVDDAVINQS